MIQVFSLNSVWYRFDLLLDLSPDQKKEIVGGSLDLFYKMSFVDNAAIFEI